METVRAYDLNGKLPPVLLTILARESVLAESYVVGGFVRDAIWGEVSKDIDIEVFGVDWAALAEALAGWGRVDRVGESFGTVKLTLSGGGTIDFSLPREEVKTGPGHRGFTVGIRSDLSRAQAADRRDFTINALYYDPRRRHVVDCVGGLEDLERKRLRPVNRKTFSDDPLRLLRAMQFVSRFELQADAVLDDLGREMLPEYEKLARERVWEEWHKWAAKSRRPSAGLQLLRRCGWLEHFPELAAMVGVSQDPEWHPEGDVFRHVCFSCDALAQLDDWRRKPARDRAVYMLAVLLHDLGKAVTTVEVLRKGRKRIVSPGHDRASVGLAQQFLNDLGAPQDYLRRIKPLVANHMSSFTIETDRAIRRLAYRLQPETIEGLCLVMEADSRGRPPLPGPKVADIRHLLSRSESLQYSRSAPKRILRGQDLIDLGVRPGPAMGKILAAAYEAQLDGEITDRESALEWVRANGLPE